MFADVREKSMLEWIEEKTATGTFCQRSRKHTTLTPPPGHLKTHQPTKPTGLFSMQWMEVGRLGVIGPPVSGPALRGWR